MKKIILAVFACMMLLSVAVTPVAARGTRTTFTGTSYYIDELDPGEQWLEGDTYYIRGLEERYQVEASDPRMAGYSTDISSLNFTLADPPVFGYGPIWGTSTTDPDDSGGYWTCRAFGYRTQQGFNYHCATCRGHSAYGGLTARIFYRREITDPSGPMDFYGVITDWSGGWQFSYKLGLSLAGAWFKYQVPVSAYFIELVNRISG